MLREYVLFLANTGIRHGTEVINLKWKNLEYFIDKDGQRYLVINVDGKRGKREAIARQNTTDYLERLKDLNPKLKKLTLDQIIDKRINTHLFLSASGKRISVMVSEVLLGNSYGNWTLRRVLMDAVEVCIHSDILMPLLP